ncbi:MAG TPA: hypothetical protein VH815_02090 [Acidobacteriota bacterium]|jgi:hypothetical protein
MKTLIGIFLLLIISVPALAQVEQINATMSKIPSAITFNLGIASLKQIKGVNNVTADMNSGRIQINTRGGVSVRSVMDGLRVTGGQTTDLEIVVRGKIEKRGNRLVLVAPSQNELFIVEARAQNQMATNMAEKQNKARVVAGLSGSGNQYTLTVKKLQKN